MTKESLSEDIYKLRPKGWDVNQELAKSWDEHLTTSMVDGVGGGVACRKHL